MHFHVKHLFTAGDHANRSQDDSLEEGSHFSEVVNGQIGVVNKQEGLSPNKKSSKAKNQFPCPKCNKVWNWPWELRRHLVMHFKEKERLDASAYKCDECGRGFQWKRDLA